MWLLTLLTQRPSALLRLRIFIFATSEYKLCTCTHWLASVHSNSWLDTGEYKVGVWGAYWCQGFCQCVSRRKLATVVWDVDDTEIFANGMTRKYYPMWYETRMTQKYSPMWRKNDIEIFQPWIYLPICCGVWAIAKVLEEHKRETQKDETPLNLHPLPKTISNQNC